MLELQTRPRSRLRTTLGTTKKSRSMELPSLRHDQSFMLLVCGQAMVSMYVFVTHIFAYILVLGIRNVPVDQGSSVELKRFYVDLDRIRSPGLQARVKPRAVTGAVSENPCLKGVPNPGKSYCTLANGGISKGS